MSLAGGIASVVVPRSESVLPTSHTITVFHVPGYAGGLDKVPDLAGRPNSSTTRRS